MICIEQNVIHTVIDEYIYHIYRKRYRICFDRIQLLSHNSECYAKLFNFFFWGGVFGFGVALEGSE